MANKYSLEDIILEDPRILDEEFLTVDELLTEMKEIIGFEVLSKFTDDHVECYHVSISTYDGTYETELMWVGDQDRIFYQSEISQSIREYYLKPYFAEKLINQ